MSFTPDSRHLLACAFPQAGPRPVAPGDPMDYRGLIVLDAARAVPARSLTVEGQTISSMAASADGRVAAGTRDGLILLLDAVTGQQLREFKTILPPVHAVRFSRDGKRLFACDNGNHVYAWMTADGSLIFRKRLNAGLVDFALSPDETWLAAAGTHNLRVLDLTFQAGDQGLVSLPGHTNNITGVTFLPQTSQVVSCSWDGSVRIWSLPPRPALGP
jgi:WD40 repeat protein